MSRPEKIGAFFDLDGTLLPPPSLERRFIAYLLAHRRISTANVARWFGHFADRVIVDPRDATIRNKRYLAGVHESAARAWEIALGTNTLPFFKEGISRVDWHLECGHRVFFVSGTLAPLARAVARRLYGVVEVRATELETADRVFTGRIAGAHLSFGVKAATVSELAAAYELDLTESFAYGNEMSDARMLEAVGHPVAVNPSWRLLRAAQTRGWSIYGWSESQEVQNPAQRAAADALFFSEEGR